MAAKNESRVSSTSPMQLAIVVPCFNEQDSLSETASRLRAKLEDLIKLRMIAKTSAVFFIDDGSRDETWGIVENLAANSKFFHGVKLSRNRGHQNALMAGLTHVSNSGYDLAISMDADLQDDINAIDEMILHFHEGSEIVYGVRKERKTDTMFKKYSALGFYKLMSFLGADSVYNHADYRLMSRRSIMALTEFREVNLFLRGMIPLVGFQSSIVEYDRGERFAGESKYPVKKMLSFAIDGITSFSIKPLRFVTVLGIAILVVSLIVMLYALVAKFSGGAVSGWTFTVISVWFIGGVQMFCTGIVGEYIGKIYSEVKSRPTYIIDKVI